jgi:hypothetical protein
VSLFLEEFSHPSKSRKYRGRMDAFEGQELQDATRLRLRQTGPVQEACGNAVVLGERQHPQQF